jgi:hypothetical protein
MNAPPEPLGSQVGNGSREFRSLEPDTALKRDRLLQRVRAARKRLSPGPTTMPRLR